MFKEKIIKQIKTGTRLVSFCSDCNSQNIETIHTCKDCGSHNITTDWTDKRSEQPILKDKTIFVYTCDNCGKEFECMETNNVISFYEGEFMIGNYENAFSKVFIDKDLCNECLAKVIMKLDDDLSNITSENHIKNTIDRLLNK